MDYRLTEYLPDQIWLKEYPIRYAGTGFNSRMTVVKLRDARLMLHSPCEIDDATKDQIESLGEVAFIVAPGTYHYFYVSSAQQAFPKAQTYICPGIEQKRPDIQFDWILSDRPDPGWEDDFEQALVRGARHIWEVAFNHKPSKTLILVDVIENFTNATQGVSLTLKLWWKLVFRMWNNPKPAPEYQLGWKDKRAARKSLERILEWDFERIIMAHGDVVEENAKATLTSAWKKPLES